MIWKLENPEAAAPFFAGRKDTLIHSALAGIMGDVYGNGTAAMVNLGDNWIRSLPRSVCRDMKRTI